jgi:hypothetical protein
VIAIAKQRFADLSPRTKRVIAVVWLAKWPAMLIVGRIMGHH